MIITAVKDLKSDIFLQPQFQRSVADAMRNWEIIANEGDHLVSRFPDDYVLYKLGNFNAETGEVTVSERPENLASAAELKKRPTSKDSLPFPEKGPKL